MNSSSDAACKAAAKKPAGRSKSGRCIKLVFVPAFICAVIVCFQAGCPRRQPIRPTFGMDSPPEEWIRVLLFENIREFMLDAPAAITVSCDRQKAGARFGSTGQGICIAAADGGGIRVGPHLFEQEVLVTAEELFYFSLNGKFYRGNLLLTPNQSGDGLQAVNYLPTEAYLLGVVGAEMPGYWEPQALKAQAVASRTYALSKKIAAGEKRRWDVSRTESCQVYGGISAETATVRQAVEETAGQVLAVEDGGSRQILPSYYSSVCGGHTEDSFAVFGDRFAPLCGVACPYCEPIAKAGFFNWGPQAYTLEQVNAKLLERYPGLSRLEGIAAIQAVRFGAIGRVTGVQLSGNNGKTDFLRGEDFRLALDPSGRRLKNAVFQLRCDGKICEFSQGRGFGHGVGMCQTGAEYLARQGWKYDRILNYYYPGAELIDYYGKNGKL